MSVDSQSVTTGINSKFAFDLAGYLLLCHASVNIFLITASGQLNPIEIIPTAIDFVLAVLLLHDHSGAKVITLIRAFLGLVLVFFIGNIGDPYTATWFEAISIQLLFSSSLILLLLGYRYLSCFILGGILATFYIAYLALVVYIRFNA